MRIMRWIIMALIALAGCQKEIKTVKSSSIDGSSTKPNIILILLDDFGYEIPTCNGGESYSTPNIDSLASTGIRFTNCRVCPLCSPSRVGLLTGKYNFRNYTRWGHLNWENQTIANRLKANGYSCAVFGKWQLDGGDSAIRHFGFDTYRVFDPYQVPEGEVGARYKNPLLYKNGVYTQYANGEYADDIFTNDAIQLMTSSAKPFFIYLPYTNTHVPFTPTPDDPEYATWDETVNHPLAKRFFPSMVKYVDKLIGKISQRAPSNTVIIIMGDNGTSSNISSMYNGELVTGKKGTSTEYGIHVPLILNGRGIGVNKSFIDLPDVYTTILDLTNTPGHKGDGVSFLSDSIRPYSYGYWTFHKTEWVLGSVYKVYATGDMYDWIKDPYELNKIDTATMTIGQKIIRSRYLNIIANKH